MFLCELRHIYAFELYFIMRRDVTIVSYSLSCSGKVHFCIPCFDYLTLPIEASGWRGPKGIA